MLWHICPCQNHIWTGPCRTGKHTSSMGKQMGLPRMLGQEWMASMWPTKIGRRNCLPCRMRIAFCPCLTEESHHHSLACWCDSLTPICSAWESRRLILFHGAWSFVCRNSMVFCIHCRPLLRSQSVGQQLLLVLAASWALVGWCWLWFSLALAPEHQTPRRNPIPCSW